MMIIGKMMTETDLIYGLSEIFRKFSYFHAFLTHV